MSANKIFTKQIGNIKVGKTWASAPERTLLFPDLFLLFWPLFQLNFYF
jgi:hypothetical protein